MYTSIYVPALVFLYHSKKYCWWKKSCTTWDVLNLVNNGINYQPQLVQDFFHQQYVHIFMQIHLHRKHRNPPRLASEGFFTLAFMAEYIVRLLVPWKTIFRQSFSCPQIEGNDHLVADFSVKSVSSSFETSPNLGHNSYNYYYGL